MLLVPLVLYFSYLNTWNSLFFLVSAPGIPLPSSIVTYKSSTEFPFYWLQAGHYVNLPYKEFCEEVKGPLANKDVGIYYRDSGGELPILLLVHGFPTSSYDWYVSDWPAVQSQ
jgi:hypothetical protein